ncbi:hypothetical protein EB118_02180 [bacterium]|nr:hypothetical protein [bacterium]NDC93919.1 hypothetical protein [bacterium]NDD83248.1 hypothetical protein [bacterium]NDG28896.1 hypothetical protein [bacterium]
MNKAYVWSVLVFAVVISIVTVINKKETSELKKTLEFPRRIFQTWKSKTVIPDNMAYWSSTFKKQNPGYQYELWDDNDNRNFIKNNFSWFLDIFDGYDAAIKRADAVRYFYLYKYGGVYADMDFECLRPLDSLLIRYSDAEVLLGSMHTNETDSGHSIPNAIMISKPGAKFWLVVMHLLKKYKDSPHTETATGPILLKRAVEIYDSDCEVRVLDPSVMYPISWSVEPDTRLEILKGNPREITARVKQQYPKAYAATYWTHSW